MKTTLHLLFVLFLRVAVRSVDSNCLQAGFSSAEANSDYGDLYKPPFAIDRDVNTFYHSSTENNGSKTLKLHLTSNNIRINKVAIINRYLGNRIPFSPVLCFVNNQQIRFS